VFVNCVIIIIVIILVVVTSIMYKVNNIYIQYTQYTYTCVCVLPCGLVMAFVQGHVELTGHPGAGRGDLARCRRGRCGVSMVFKVA